MSTYTPSLTPSDIDFDLGLFLQTELNKIATAVNEKDFVLLTKWNRAPDKIFDGMVVYADGTNWEPVTGEGEGVYCYYNSTWNKLG